MFACLLLGLLMVNENYYKLLDNRCFYTFVIKHNSV